MKRGILLMALPLLLASCSEETSEADVEAVPVPPQVLLYEVQSAAAEKFTFIGGVEPQVKTEKAFRTSGRVTSVDVATGEFVKAGEVLATVDASTLQLQRNTAEAQLRSVEAQLSSVESSNERQAALIERGVVAPTVEEDAANNLAVARASYASAKATYDKAANQLDYARITADYDGIVLSSDLQVGQFASASSTVIKIAKPDQRDAVIDVPDSVARRIKTGDAFSIRNIMVSEPPVKGRVREIAPNADDATGTYRIYVAIEDAPVTLRIGSIIEAKYLTADAAILAVPESAVLEEGEERFVWKYDAATQTVHKTPVELGDEAGASTHGMVAVATGVSPGDRLVQAGVHDIHENETVKPMVDAQ